MLELPAKGKKYPGLGYKRLQDRPPKAQQQQQAAEAKYNRVYQLVTLFKMPADAARGAYLAPITCPMPPKRKRKRPVTPAQGAAGASGSGQQEDEGQGQGEQEVIAERRQVIKAAFRALVEAARPDLSPAQVDAVVAQLDIEDPTLLPQIRAAMDLLTNASVQEHLMRGPHHRGIMLLPGDINSLNANATKIITSITEYYRHPQRLITWWAKAVRVVEGGFSKEAQKHFPQLVQGRLDYSQPDREHNWRLPPNSVLRQDRWREEVVRHRSLLGLPAEWEAGVESIGKGVAGWLPLENRVRYVMFVNRSLEAWQTAPHAKPHGNSHRRRTCPRPFTMLPMVGVRARHFVIDDRVLCGLLADLGQDTLTRAKFEADSLPHWQRFIQYSQLQNSGWEFARRVETDGVNVSVHFVRSQAVHEPVELPFIGRELTATSDYSPATHIAVGVDPGVTQVIKAAHAQWHPVTGQVVRQWEWELTKGQLKHDSGLTKAKQDTARWSAAIQPQLQQLAAATPVGTTLDALQAHILALKANWDPLWEEYLKPRWRQQRLALHHAQERIIEGFCKKV
ncbi:hypothetical protein QJQ45_030467 [Haematococcus lacustris]|nr:hypothetical protein QJQ45_030467 [Haematococcus lacustris]